MKGLNEFTNAINEYKFKVKFTALELFLIALTFQDPYFEISNEIIEDGNKFGHFKYFGD